LTEASLKLLLNRLDPEPDAAGEKYLDLRTKIVHILRWRGCEDWAADDLADVAIDRIVAKLEAGELIENLAGFAAGITRFVWLEYSRSRKENAVGDDLPNIEVRFDVTRFDDVEPRIRCMRSCLGTPTINAEDRRLILGYYDLDPGEKAKESRRRLATTFGVTVDTLRVRACRLRSQLETCVNKCVAAMANRSEAT